MKNILVLFSGNAILRLVHFSWSVFLFFVLMPFIFLQLELHKASGNAKKKNIVKNLWNFFIRIRVATLQIGGIAK
jgi:hypothetical protein